MRRFWKSAEVVEAGDGFGIALDGRPVKTPARADLIVPTWVLAEAIAAEWNDCGEAVEPREMPLTGLANAAIDRVAQDKASFAAGLARYAESDLTCYRAEGPEALVARQSESWDVLLAWARRRYDIDFACVSGVMHVPQPEETVRKLGKLHLYDCLRANKSLAAWGVEGRVPFLDKEFIDIAMRLGMNW